LGVSDNHGDFGRARVFQAAPPRETGPLLLAIHVRGDPRGFAVRLRELAQAVDPALRVIDPKPLPRLAESVSGFWFALLVGFTGVTLMLSLAGVYAVTAFSVARRTREIGVRVALGARPQQVLATVFKRPLVQIALGVGVGAVLGLGLANNDLSDVHLDDFGVTAVIALSTTLCCALACIVPTRRALRIQPSQALKDEG
ncbi:MAG TPA: FtsX-like permease family protein, partial [Longimicrobium sp.]|nr:FtsX-like permease family protein [Longimicrobium sp.]